MFNFLTPIKKNKIQKMAYNYKIKYKQKLYAILIRNNMSIIFMLKYLILFIKINRNNGG